MKQKIVFFLENKNERDLFLVSLGDLIQILNTDDITDPDCKSLSCIGNRLVVNIENHPIDLPRLTDFLNKSVNTFQLIPERIESSKLFPVSETNNTIYNLIPASRNVVVSDYKNQDEFNLERPIDPMNYIIKDGYRFLQLKTTVIKNGDIHELHYVIKYKNNLNDFVLDTLESKRNTESFADYNITKNYIELQTWFKDGKLHKENDEPARIYFINGLIYIEEWFINGDLYRRQKEKPVRIGYDRNHRIIFNQWSLESRTGENAKEPLVIEYNYSYLQYWDRSQIPDEDQPNILIELIGRNSKYEQWGSFEFNIDNNWGDWFILSRSNDKPASIYSQINSTTQSWLLDGVRFREDNKPDIVNFYTERDDPKKYIAYEIWSNAENNFPKLVRYKKSRIGKEKGCVIEEDYETDYDYPSVIEYREYQPEIMVYLFDKYKHLLDPSVYENHKQIYEKDANEFFNYKSKSSLMKSELIKEAKIIFEKIFESREEIKVSPSTGLNNMIKFYLEKEPDGKGFIESFYWQINDNDNHRDGGPAIIKFHENGHKKEVAWMTNKRLNRSLHYPAYITYDKHGNVLQESYYRNGIRMDPIPIDVTDDENNDEEDGVRNEDLEEDEILETMFPDD